MIEITLAVFFGLWLALLIVRQFHPKWLRPLTRLDALMLLPSFCFFARGPVRREYRVLVRSGNGWREVPQPRRTFRAALWNPERRRRKTLFECARAVALSRGRKDACYRTLHRWAKRSGAPEFAIAADAQVVFESGAAE